jgi:hypothetical protein
VRQQQIGAAALAEANLAQQRMANVRPSASEFVSAVKTHSPRIILDGVKNRRGGSGDTTSTRGFAPGSQGSIRIGVGAMVIHH